MLPWLLLSVLSLSVLDRVAAQSQSQERVGVGEKFTCFDTPSNVSFCHGVLNAKMKLPNWLGDETVQELISNSGSWIDMAQMQLKTPCHEFAQHFMCSLITPVCVKPNSLKFPIEAPPCRGFCEDVRDKCTPILRSLNYDWPINFRCSRFPDSGVCISPNSTDENMRRKSQNTCEFCANKIQHKSLVTHFCVSSMVIEGSVTKEGLVVPLNNSLSSGVLHGMVLARRRVVRIRGARLYFNVSEVCTCQKPSRKVHPASKASTPASCDKRNGNDCNVYLIFVDQSFYGDLAASLVIPLNALSKQQRKEYRAIKAKGVKKLCTGEGRRLGSQRRNKAKTRKP